VIAVDPLTDFDWASHWRGLVETAEVEGTNRLLPAYWDHRAPVFAYASAAESRAFLDLLEPFLAAHKTLIDVGCGTGGLAATLAARLARVTGVEPSAGMRAHIPRLANLEVVADSWQEAQVETADLVISSHVLYYVPDPVAFIEKMEAKASERCFLQLIDDRGQEVFSQLWELLAGRKRDRLPRFYDAYNLLRWMGVRPEVVTLAASQAARWQSLEQAVEDCRARLGDIWREEVGRAWLAEQLKPVPEGGVGFTQSDFRPSSVAHWRPRRIAAVDTG
jgi:SAM-dependent methyltransferase